MGPYCNFCDQRCFVPRMLPFKTETLLMATCSRGMEHDRKVTGFDFSTAINPSTLRSQVVPMQGPWADRGERARRTAVALEQENAELVRLVREARALLPAVGSCSCDLDEDEDLPFERDNCAYCKVSGLLAAVDFAHDPTGLDRLMDALAGPLVDEVAGS